MTQFKTEADALKAVARKAMDDLMGYSTPPQGKPDNYPFNAPLLCRTLPADWQEAADAVVAFVYQYETLPADLAD